MRRPRTYARNAPQRGGLRNHAGTRPSCSRPRLYADCIAGRIRIGYPIYRQMKSYGRESRLLAITPRPKSLRYPLGRRAKASAALDSPNAFPADHPGGGSPGFLGVIAAVRTCSAPDPPKTPFDQRRDTSARIIRAKTYRRATTKLFRRTQRPSDRRINARRRQLLPKKNQTSHWRRFKADQTSKDSRRRPFRNQSFVRRNRL